MAASANLNLDIYTDNIIGHPVKANTHIYQHAIVGDDGAGAARGLVAGDPCLGIAYKEADNTVGSTLVGAIQVQVRRDVSVKATISGVAVTDIGAQVYASADDTFTLTAGSNSPVGYVEKYLASNTAIVRVAPVHPQVDVAKAITLSNTLTVGVDDTGYDVKFFGATTGKYFLWDESADKLIIAGTTDAGTSLEADAYTVGGVAGVDFSGAITNLTVVKGIVTAAS